MSPETDASDDSEEALLWDDIELDINTSLLQSKSQQISKHIIHSKCPHRVAMSIDAIIDSLTPIDVVSPIIRYFEYGDNGSGL